MPDTVERREGEWRLWVQLIGEIRGKELSVRVEVHHELAPAFFQLGPFVAERGTPPTVRDCSSAPPPGP